MASPAQVANDMDTRATFLAKRDTEVATACRDAARVIRGYLDGQPPDGRTVAEVLTRLYGADEFWIVRETADTRFAIARAAATIRDLRKETSHAA